jgi:formylglycine-generating enzyme required for sulfatase activity
MTERRLPFEPETVLIPAGEFIMGSDAGRNVEEPSHPVSLPAYRIGRYPVTNREYQAVVQDSRRSSPRDWKGDRYPEGKGDHPMVWVSWHDAIAYCRWLSEQTGRPYRLPTEAEWEKAASWDPEAKNKRRYPWGDEYDSQKCNTSESGIRDTTPVSKFSPEGESAYSVADMAGNVLEWCQDWYGDYYYRRSPSENPSGPESGVGRVLRGGSWNLDQRLARCAVRRRDFPDRRSAAVGFRVVVSPGSP